MSASFNDEESAKPQFPSNKQGYTAWAAHLSKDDDYQIFRRFRGLSLRTILHYQDKLRELENKLSRQNEVALDISRRDEKDEEREKLVDEISSTLDLYVKALTSYQTLQKFMTPTSFKISGLRESIEFYKPLSIEESAYAEHVPASELLIVEANRNSKWADYLTRWRWLAKLLRLQDEESLQKSAEDNFYTTYYSEQLVYKRRKFVLLLLCLIFLIAPIVAFFMITDPIHRMIVFIGFMVVFVGLFLLVEASDMEVYGVSAAYAAVLSAVLVAAAEGWNRTSG